MVEKVATISRILDVFITNLIIYLPADSAGGTACWQSLSAYCSRYAMGRYTLIQFIAQAHPRED